MLTRCYFCRGNVKKKSIAIDWRWGERLFVIRNVPVGVCEQCGEKYLDSGVYKDMERITATKDYILGKMTVDILGFPVQDAA